MNSFSVQELAESEDLESDDTDSGDMHFSLFDTESVAQRAFQRRFNFGYSGWMLAELKEQPFYETYWGRRLSAFIWNE